MRIEELHLLAFGHFSNKVIDLSRGKEGLHIIYGPNESGKSSSLRALHQVLYGIPTKSTDNFKHAHPDMRIGVVLKHSDGSTLRALRRKGNTKTLRRLDAENEIIEQAVLQRYLGNINQTTFESMFGIDHPRLVSGGEAILSGSGELGQLLFSAGSGIADLRSVLAGLEKDYQDLYTRTGSTRVINKKLSEYAEAKRNLRESELPNSEWERHDQSLKQALRRKEQLDAKLGELQKQLAKLKRYRDSIPLIAERALYDSQMFALKNVVSLPEQFEENARELLEQSLLLKREKSQDSKRLTELKSELDVLTSRRFGGSVDAIIERSTNIEMLQQKLGSHQKAAQDRLSLDQARVEEQERARACLRDLGRPDDFASASTLRMSVQEKTRLRKLALERRALWQAYSDAQALRQRTEQRLRACSEEMSKLARIPACEKLLVCYKRIQQDPQMEERSIAEANKLERALKQTVLDLRKLQVKDVADNITLNNIADLHSFVHAKLVPDSHMIDGFDKEFGQLNKEIETLGSRRSDLSNELREIQYRLQEHELKIAAPTEADLTEIRRQRDSGWKLVLKTWKEKLETSSDVSEYLAGTNSSAELSVAYEWALNKSDTVADRLRHEADHVALKIQLTAQVQKLNSHLVDANAKLSSREEKKALLKEQWFALWTGITDRQMNPTTARLWTAQFEIIRNGLSILLENIDASKFNSSLVQRSKAELQDALLEAGWTSSSTSSSSPSSPASFSSSENLLLNLVEQAQQCLDKFRALKQSQNDLERELSKLQVDLTNNATTEQTRKSEIDLWANSWQPAVEGLGLGATTSPEELTAFLDRLEQFFSHYDQISSYQRRIVGIDRDADQFAADVHETVSRVAAELSKLSAEEAAIELFANLKKSKEIAQRQAIIKERYDELFEGNASRADALQKLSDKLSQMILEAAVSSETELLDAAKKSVQKQRLEEVLDGYNRQLRRLAEGSVFETFIEETKSQTLVELDAQITRIDEEITQTLSEKDNLQIAIGSEKANSSGNEWICNCR